MKKYFLLTLTLAMFTMSGMTQKLPDWVTNKPTPTNSTYLYVVESATGQNEQIARNQAIAEVFRSTAMRIGQPFDSDEINRALQQGTEYNLISSQYNIPINKVCEYTDNKVSPCRVYVLCQVAKAGNIRVEFDDFNACYEGANKFYANEALYADGFDVSRNGITLSDQQVRALFANSRSYSLYNKGMAKSGRGLITAGAISLPVGALFAGIGYLISHVDSTSPEDKEGGKICEKVGIGVSAVGGVCLTIGLIRRASGKAKIRKAVNLYNNGRMYSQNGLEMEYGLAGSNVYLTFRF